MLRKSLMVALALACGTAAAQEAGSISISGGPGNVQFVPAPVVIEPVDIQNFYFTSQVLVIVNPLGLIGAAMRQGERIEAPLAFDAATLQGDPVFIGVEGEGVRMPDEQFSLP